MVLITTAAQTLVSEVLEAGEIAIDATAGNGYDSQFLLSCVGEQGRVMACDVQQDAIDATRQRCCSARQLELHQGDHAQLLMQFVNDYSNQIGAVMFNLGYLPGGDKSVITAATTTALALQSSMQLLRAGGILSVIAYVGHSGGCDEAIVVDEVLTQFVNDYSASEAAWPDQNLPQNSPRLYAVTKN